MRSAEEIAEGMWEFRTALRSCLDRSKAGKFQSIEQSGRGGPVEAAAELAASDPRYSNTSGYMAGPLLGKKSREALGAKANSQILKCDWNCR
jgi:hypothetical protein